MREALHRALGFELHFAAIALHRKHRGDAQFGRLLQDPVHLLAARDALHERDAQRRFVVDRAWRTDLRIHAALVGDQQRRRIIAAVAVEQHARIAFLQAQHANQMDGGILGEREDRARLQRHVDEYARGTHQAASFVAWRMASRVARASRSS